MNDKEEWKLITELTHYPFYFSNLGRMKGGRYNRIIKLKQQHYEFSMGVDENNKRLYTTLFQKDLYNKYFPYEWIKDLEEGEECREHPTHKGYYLTTKGRCFSTHMWEWCEIGLVKGFPYPRITIHRKPKLIHILLCETFIPNPHNLPMVLHKNDIKTDYRLENLYWGEVKQNYQDSVKNGRRTTKSYTLSYKGKTISVPHLKLWCRENNLSYHSVHSKIRRGMNIE
jgi:hypothetical protein